MLALEDKTSWFDDMLAERIGLLLSFFKKRGFDHDDSWDLTQQTIAKALVGRDGFLGSQAEVFSGWLIRIAKNVWKNHLRFKYSKINQHTQTMSPLPENDRPSLVDFPGKETDPLQQLIAGEGKRHLLLAMDTLPPRMQYCLVLRIYHELSYEEISKIMKVNINTVKSTISQAKARLKKHMEFQLKN